MANKILIGNTFSLTLIRKHSVMITEYPLSELQTQVRSGFEVCSFWGHENTLAAAERVTGFSLRPRMKRPALVLTQEGLPSLGGDVFSTCWVLSPDYEIGYRPPIGVEVDESKIKGWNLLKLTWQIHKEIING